MTVVVNFFAGPGAGKSTTKAGLFFEMKQRGFKVESVDEFAKELVYEGTIGSTSEMFMLAEQDRRQRRLVDKVDFILTDAPLLKSAFYVRGVYATDHYRNHIEKLFDNYDNFNVWVCRTKPYATYGREQTEAEADAIGRKMLESIRPRVHLVVDGDRKAPLTVLRALETR